MLKHRDTKQKILKESATLFRKIGYEAATLRQIAKMTGIKAASIYNHFGSKQEILFNIMNNTLSELLYLNRSKIQNVLNPQEKLRLIIDTHIRYHIFNFDNTFVTDTELRSLAPDNIAPIMSLRKEYENFFKEVFIDVIGERNIDKNSIKLTTFATLQMSTSLSFWFKNDGEVSLDQVIDHYYRMIFAFISESTKQTALTKISK